MGEEKRLKEPEKRKLAMPGKDGPFSGRTVEGKYWGQDVHKIGKKGPEDVAIYGENVAKKWFETDFRLAAKHNHDRIIAITGREGYGKSTLGDQLAFVANSDLTVDDVIFDRQKLSDRLKNAESQDTIVVDEAGISLFSQEWWDEMQREIVKRLVAGRVKGLRIFFITPHLGMLNNQIRNRRLDMWLYCVPVGRYDRGEAQVREPLEDKYKMAIYWDPRFTMKFGALEGEFWDDYMEKKNDFVNAVWEGAEEEQGAKIERLKTIMTLQEKGLTSEEISNHLTISASRVRDLMSKLKSNETLQEKVEEA